MKSELVAESEHYRIFDVTVGGIVMGASFATEILEKHYNKNWRLATITPVQNVIRLVYEKAQP